MFMTFISTKLPEKSNNNPFLGLIFSILFFVYSFALALASMTTFFAGRTTPVPKWLHRLAPVEKSLNINKSKRKMSSADECYLNENSYSVKSSNEIEINTFNDETKDKRKPNEDHRKNTNGKDDVDITWADVMRTIDKFMFCFFLALLLIVPIIVGVALNTNFLGTFWNKTSYNNKAKGSYTQLRHILFLFFQILFFTGEVVKFEHETFFKKCRILENTRREFEKELLISVFECGKASY